MRLFDTHCHFESSDPAEIAAILRRAKAAGVEKLMAVGGSRELNLSAQRAADLGSAAGVQGSEDLPAVICALGYDRDQVGKIKGQRSEVKGQTEDDQFHCLTSDLGSLTSSSAFNLSPSPSLRAIGEIGLDYHYSPETREAQLKLFAAQLDLARSRELPVVIHTREADEDTVSLLKEIPSRGIIHCYTGTPEYAKRFLDLGFYVSFSGIVTFRAADNVRASAAVVPDDRLLIETDSPYLAPVPMRGQPNEPAFIRHTCDFLARERKMSSDALAELTFANAERCLAAGHLTAARGLC